MPLAEPHAGPAMAGLATLNDPDDVPPHPPSAAFLVPRCIAGTCRLTSLLPLCAPPVLSPSRTFIRAGLAAERAIPRGCGTADPNPSVQANASIARPRPARANAAADGLGACATSSRPRSGAGTSNSSVVGGRYRVGQSATRGGALYSDLDKRTSSRESPGMLCRTAPPAGWNTSNTTVRTSGWQREDDAGNCSRILRSL